MSWHWQTDASMLRSSFFFFFFIAFWWKNFKIQLLLRVDLDLLLSNSVVYDLVMVKELVYSGELNAVNMATLCEQI